MKIDPTKIIKAAGKISSGEKATDSVKEIAKETIKTKLAAILTVKLVPVILIVTGLVLLISFIFYAVSAVAASVRSTGGGECLLPEFVSAQKEQLSVIKDEDMYKRAMDALNKRVDEVGVCSQNGMLAEGINGGAFYDQKALNDNAITPIKNYLAGKGTLPSIESIIAIVNAAIDGNKAGLSPAEIAKKKAEVNKKIMDIYNSNSSSKWQTLLNYLEDERGPTLWKGEIGRVVAAAVAAQVGKPYISGNRWKYTGQCYMGSNGPTFIQGEVERGCGFDCSSLATYGAAVGNRVDTSVLKGTVAACNGSLCKYNGTVSTIYNAAAIGEWAFISSEEMAPGDMVLLSSSVETNFHVVIYIGTQDGKKTWVHAPSPGRLIEYVTFPWWNGVYGVKYVRPYSTIKF
jgi:hypothetical protein